MIKIKIKKLSHGIRKYDNKNVPVADFMYGVYFLGFLFHAVTLTDIPEKEINRLFPSAKIIT